MGNPNLQPLYLARFYALSLESARKIQNKDFERSQLTYLLNLMKKNNIQSVDLNKNNNINMTMLVGNTEYLLNKLEKNESSADLLSRKILVENLQRRLSDLDGMMKSNKTIQEDVENLYSRLDDSMKTEKDLLALTSELEQRKKELHANIEKEDQKKVAAQTQFDDVKNKMADSANGHFIWKDL